jgi:hypothetical protein
MHAFLRFFNRFVQLYYCIVVELCWPYEKHVLLWVVLARTLMEYVCV